MSCFRNNYRLLQFYNFNSNSNSNDIFIFYAIDNLIGYYYIIISNELNETITTRKVVFFNSFDNKEDLLYQVTVIAKN